MRRAWKQPLQGMVRAEESGCSCEGNQKLWGYYTELLASISSQDWNHLPLCPSDRMESFAVRLCPLHIWLSWTLSFQLPGFPRKARLRRIPFPPACSMLLHSSSRLLLLRCGPWASITDIISWELVKETDTQPLIKTY